MTDEESEPTSAKNPWVTSLVTLLCAALAAAGTYFGMKFQSEAELDRLRIQLHADEVRDQRNQFKDFIKIRKTVYDDFRSALGDFRDVSALIERDMDSRSELDRTLSDQSNDPGGFEFANNGDLSQARSKIVRAWGKARGRLQIALQAIEIYGSCPVRLHAQVAYPWSRYDKLTNISDDDSEELRELYAAMRHDLTALSQQPVEAPEKDDLSAKCSALSRPTLDGQGNLREDLRHKAGSYND